MNDAQLQDMMMRQRARGLTRESVMREFGCWGSYHPARCAQNGFIGPCPVKRTCQHETQLRDAERRRVHGFSQETIDRLRGRLKIPDHKYLK